jgi:hypothetical protein
VGLEVVVGPDLPPGGPGRLPQDPSEELRPGQGLGPELRGQGRPGQGQEVPVVPPVPARVGVLPEVRGRLHGAGGVGLAKGPEEQGAQGVAVVGGLVLGAPEVDGGMGPQGLHHGPGLAQSLPGEGLVGGVAPLEGKVLPDQNPLPVAGPVEGGVGHVGVDPRCV